MDQTTGMYFLIHSFKLETSEFLKLFFYFLIFFSIFNFLLKFCCKWRLVRSTQELILLTLFIISDRFRLIKQTSSGILVIRWLKGTSFYIKLWYKSTFH